MFWPFKKKQTRQAKSKRVEPRLLPATRYAFSGADTGRLFSNWFTTGTPINQQLASELNALITRARDLAKNSDYIRRFFQIAKTNIVGNSGFTFHSQVTFSNGKPDADARAAIEKAWKAFGKKGVPCSQNRLSLTEMLNLGVESLLRDGELILLEYVSSEENEFNVSYKFIDPAVLNVNHKGDHGGNPVKMGIETDDRGRVIAYHFHSTDTTHASYYTTGGRGYIRVDASRVIHRFITEYPDQIRGFPHIAAAMVRLQMLDKYEEAELVSARMGAASMGFVTRGEDGGSLEGANAVVDEQDSESIYYSDPVIEAEPGAFHILENGSQVIDWSGNHVPTAYKEFLKGVLRGIASSLGVSYNSLANDLEGVNYSSIRQAVLEERDTWKAMQNWMIEGVVSEIFERWLKYALLAGAIKYPSGQALKSSQIDRLKNYSFVGRRWQWVDPLKDITAHKEAYGLRVTSVSDIIREQGGDPEEVFNKIAEEKALFESLGITPESLLNSPSQESPNNAEDPTEDKP